ncbi:MAG: tetratricopeptide repeat protein [Chloroflexota bacterium]|nr:tetratricopeptide repeat protein [Chloroflexota bacterium]
MNQYGQNVELEQILAITNEIARRSAGGNYIYRGETQCWPQVSSSLYRDNPRIQNVETTQQADLVYARQFTRETDEFEILTELQHYGGSTNLIDFTTDYLIALFFACDGNFTQNGRVILLDKSGEMGAYIRKPRNPDNRVNAQKSVFVRPPAGYIDIQPGNNIQIPQERKKPILDYLQKYHGISTNTIYNDLHGFIRSRKIHRESTKLLSEGFSHHFSGSYPLAIECYTKALDYSPNFGYGYVYRGDAHYETCEIDKAIDDYNRFISRNLNDAEVYDKRGNAYYYKREYDFAIADYGTAIGINPNNSDFYVHRGNAHYCKGDYAFASSDYTLAIAMNPDNAQAYYRLGVCNLLLWNSHSAGWNFSFARNLGFDIISAFQEENTNVSIFQQLHNVTLPLDIAQMLGG